MKPHIEEAYRALVLADRDITAFEILKKSKDAHIAIIGFHAQQAIEKSLKAVLFAHQIEFDRSHDLVKLAGLLRNHQIQIPVEDKKLRQLNPFAVMLRYDDVEITPQITPATTSQLVNQLRRWAEEQVKATEQNR